jgi:coniferyl-aldehyde dehydrogenase
VESSNVSVESAGTSVRRACDELKAACAREPFPAPALRKKWLEALLEMTRDTQDGIARAAAEDFGHRSVHESKLGETWLTASNLSYLIEHFEDWVEPRPKRVAWPLWFGRAEVRAQPKGVVGIISPWNYPFMLAVEQLAGALAAGNRVMLKLSEHTPRTSELLRAELSRRLPKDVLQVFAGGVEEGEAFCALPLDHLMFTGSTAVGRRVYAAAAQNLVPVTLELGGKSPAILHESFSPERFASAVLLGKCFSAGQSCVAPDYALVPRGSEAAIETAFRKRFQQNYPTLVSNPDYSSLASIARRDRILALQEEAVSKGARAVRCDPETESFESSTKLPLTLLFDCPNDARVLQEEIFGPLLPIVPYDSLDDAIRYVNERARPLALYYFDDAPSRVTQVLERTVAGGVTVNATLLHFICDDLPRGAVGGSGTGAYHGRMSFEAFSHQKSVFHQSRLNGVELFAPPYGRPLEWLLRWLIGR